MPDDGELHIEVGGQNLSGWTAIRVTRGCERVPADFDISATERYPGQASEVVITPGDECQVSIGGDLVLTGYVDRYQPAMTASQHIVRVQGRSRSEDLVDCSAGVLPDGTTRGMTMDIPNGLVALAQTLADPFHITVRSLSGDTFPVPSPYGGGAGAAFSIILTETPFEIIERVARYVGALAYDAPNGDLVIANVGAGSMASGFAQGVNVQAASVTFSIDQRYSFYLPTVMSVDMFHNMGLGQMYFTPARDEGVKRFRPLVVVSEQPSFGQAFAEKRAQWEAARRRGRSQAVRVTCDSWRDSGGRLWEPNFFAPIDLPELKLAPPDPWVIGEVTYARDLDTGTTANLLLMPKEAFTPELSILMLFDWQVAEQLGQGGAR
jgi:prophage tail gpP-like protein